MARTGITIQLANDAQQANNGCWGKCLASDVITAAGRDRGVQVVTEVVGAGMPKYLSVQPVPGRLTFSVGRSRYERALQVKGYNPGASCAADCTWLSSVAVDPAMCAAGVEADVVLSITKPPGLSGGQKRGPA